MRNVTLPAPTGGWNAVSSLAEMQLTDAVVMDNMIPLSTAVRMRLGCSAHTNDLGTSVETLVSFNSAAAPKLIAGTGGKLIDVTAGGAGTNLGTGYTNNKWQDAHHNDRIVLVNGADSPVTWDGTTFGEVSLTLQNVTGAGNEELVLQNPDFTGATGWTTGTGWSIGGGNASCDGTQTGDSDLSETVAFQEGRLYRVQYTVSGYSAGNVTAVAAGTEGTDRSANGTYTEIITAGSGSTLAIRADADFVGDIDDVSVQLAGANFIGVCNFKGALFYWEADDTAFYYPDTAGAYQGVYIRFDLDEFTSGGTVTSCFTWTRDAGDGVDDFFVVWMSTGQAAVYQGDDPGGSSWSLVGVFDIGAPISIRGQTKVGADVVMLSRDGFPVLSAALTEGRYSENSLFSFKISSAARTAAERYGGNFGWSCTLFPKASLFIVNVPTSATSSVQFVRNTTTGAWCRFTGWDAKQFCVHDNDLYYGGADGIVYKAWDGYSDNGSFIDVKVQQAYTSLGDPHRKKQVNAVEIVTNFNFPDYMDRRILVDYRDRTLPAISDPPEASVGVWDVGQWNVASWVAGDGIRATSRKSVIGFGFDLSLVLRFRSKAQNVIWHTSHLIMKNGGYI